VFEAKRIFWRRSRGREGRKVVGSLFDSDAFGFFSSSGDNVTVARSCQITSISERHRLHTICSVATFYPVIAVDMLLSWQDIVPISSLSL